MVCHLQPTVWVQLIFWSRVILGSQTPLGCCFLSIKYRN